MDKGQHSHPYLYPQAQASMDHPQIYVCSQRWIYAEMGQDTYTHAPPLNYHKLLQAFYLIHRQPEKKLRFFKLGHSKTSIAENSTSTNQVTGQ